ncbi:MAG: lysophospholipid acyltransferase family protein, partial [Bosea sp. (in: a-proteobacteria)]
MVQRSARIRPFQPLGQARTLVSALAVVAALVPIELAIRQLFPGRKPYLHKQFHKALARSFGIQTIVHGAPVREGGVLFVSNHVSYLDIPVLGAQITAAFVAKSEVAKWGFFGWIADIGRTVYVDREQRGRASEQRDQIVERLAAGADVILFPEGTNSDGVAVLPFKSALFAATEGAGAAAFL